MKFDLQYFAQSSGAVPPSSASHVGSSKATPTSSSSKSAPSSGAKTYTQSDVDRIASEAANDQAQKLNSTWTDKVNQAKAKQKKIDSMNATQLKQHIKKVHQQKLNKIMAENKKYKHDAKARQALEATTKALTKAKVPNAAALAKLAVDLDPNARDQKVKTILNWLSNYKSQYKSELLKGKNEPQTGTGTESIPHSKDGKKMNPFTYALLKQKQQGY